MTSKSIQVKCDFDLISIKITNLCNLNCTFCWQKRKTRNKNKFLDHMNMATFDTILEELSIFAPKKIFIWGGEPLLHPDISIILEKLNRNRFISCIVTNGTMLAENTEHIIKNRVGTVNISIDGTSEIHNKIRGGNLTYNKVIRGLDILKKRKKLRPIISINIVINELNYLYLHDIVKEFREFRVNGIQIQYPVFYSQETGKESEDCLMNNLNIRFTDWEGFVKSYDEINLEKLDHVLAKIKKDFPEIAFYPNYFSASDWFKKEHNFLGKCNVPWHRLNIEPNGDVNICTDYSEMVAGNLLTNSLQEIWNNTKFKKFREIISSHNLSICKHCTYYYL
jgi:radical SAM protein with 4Fe4S-binding SPASM domain